jgi:hypothetical protein
MSGIAKSKVSRRTWLSPGNAPAAKRRSFEVPAHDNRTLAVRRGRAVTTVARIVSLSSGQHPIVRSW